MLAPSDFSALKNFVRKPVHENRSKFFQWFKITSNQLTVNDFICDVVFVNNNTANFFANEFWLPSGYIFKQDGATAHTARATQNWLQTNCPDFIAKDQLPPNSPELNPLDYHVWGQCWKPITSAPFETENDRRTKGSPASDLGQPTSGTNRQSYQRVLKATEGLCCSWGWTFRTFTVTAKRNGESTDPCLTPKSALNMSDHTLSHFTHR